MPRNSDSDLRWNIDFSLALFNRSGKYFIGEDLIAQNQDLIASVYYWRLPWRSVPKGLTARVLGKLEAWDHGASLALGRTIPLPWRTGARCLHLDPLSVLHRRLSSRDMVLCHDLGPLTHGDLFAAPVGQAYELAYRLIGEIQPRLVFVSKSSADAFAARYGQPRQAQVIYPPIRAGSVDAEGDALRDVDKPFLLTVGSIGRRKNQAAAVRAFARSGLAERGFAYVICGSREPGYEEAAALATATPGVVLLPYVTDANLRWLYAEASGFVLPSLLEGFGMPVAEAMQNGLVPVVSQASVLEEVAGPGAICIDPADEDSIAAGMIAVADLGEQERQQRVAMLKQHVRQFSEEAFRRGWREALTS